MPADKPTAGAKANKPVVGEDNKPMVECGDKSEVEIISVIDIANSSSTTQSTPITSATSLNTTTTQELLQPDGQEEKTKVNDSSTLTPTTTTATDQQELAFLECLIDDVIYGECLQIHRAAKMGYIFTEPGDEMYQIKDGSGLDVFGQSLARPKKSMLCTCPQCNRNIAASRLAPHLEKCMGMGRLSARAASSKQRDPNNP